MRRLLLLPLLVSLSAAAGDLGSLAFPTSATNPQAQALFERGVGALHSFWYDEAARSFKAARDLEPSFAMAYWGEAMTHNHPIWMEQDREAARAVLAALPPGSGTAREREWLATLDALYAGDGDKRARDLAYQKALGVLAAKYGGDVEAQAFHALSILGTMARDAGDARLQIAAAAILEPLLDRVPDHPAVLHYMIHAYDDPHAPLGLRAARRYAKVAPSAHHALHMPSHIFLQLGMWDEAAASNEQSYAASVAWVDRAKLPSSKRDLHSLTWLHYIYLQQNRREDARRLHAEVSEERGTSERERSTRARMLAAWSVETGQPVESIVAGKDEAAHCAAGSTSSSDAAHYARSLAAIRRGDFDGANGGIAALAAMKENRTAQVMELTLRALAEQKRGDLGKSMELAQRAVALEETLGAPSGPPEVLKPAHELYGELLAASGRCEESREAYRKSLLRTPNRRLSLVSPPCR